ncbi:hypothetical protein QEH52_14745 [Coraliomargarita sp. SDUM461003]|uniref:Uncharacterized protein n=1 Tax=Thalassobacterium maritimum TaxID=3041265 RepID=A0ABU1AXA7_9BACT|nr:hypothetical protein [Coraliomargarita sp. SDUM461003]MDQ8208782.1 hypothetical protein [Coraliomargarita sp. SDUM461003]
MKFEPQLLTEGEAFKLVASQEKAKEKQKNDFNAVLKAEKAIEEYRFCKDGRRYLHRRVDSPKETGIGLVEIENIEIREPQYLSEFVPEGYRSEMISFSVTNYDDLYSEIKWRDGKCIFSVWTNVALKYLPALSSFKQDDVCYSYFGFTDNIDSGREKERAGTHYFNGQVYEYESCWKEPPVVLGDEPEYVVISEEAGTIVPDELYEQMDAVLRFYLENEDSLRVAYLNMQSLNNARADYLLKNPPHPEESILIYSFTPSGE